MGKTRGRQSTRRNVVGNLLQPASVRIGGEPLNVTPFTCTGRSGRIVFGAGFFCAARGRFRRIFICFYGMTPRGEKRTGKSMKLAVYARLDKQTGKPSVFPGSVAQWVNITRMTDARQLLQHVEWAAPRRTVRSARKQYGKPRVIVAHGRRFEASNGGAHQNDEEPQGGITRLSAHARGISWNCSIGSRPSSSFRVEPKSNGWPRRHLICVRDQISAMRGWRLPVRRLRRAEGRRALLVAPHRRFRNAASLPRARSSATQSAYCPV
ncbi:AraC-like DNA-binding protein [Paraburkholderia strydomiana]|nr:AraC-like DNA-binding protein [Paraburkholderia strydomiana]